MLIKKITILEKYLDFTNIFLKKAVKVLPECIRINKHIIKYKKAKQMPCSLIYNLDIVELKSFKTYIETNLANGFILFFKSFVDILILFIYKSYGNFYLCVNYWGLNILTIKN